MAGQRREILEHQLLKEEDVIYVTNQLLDILQLHDYEDVDVESADVVFDISFQKKIKFAVIMVVRGNRAQLSIIIIKKLKIYRSHVLPFIEIHGNLFHVKMPSCTWNLSVLT